MTPRDAYKFGFRLRCTEEGLTPEQTEERIKLAAEKAAGIGDLIGSGLVNGGLTLGALGVGLPVGAGALAGHFGGKALASAGDPGYTAEDVNQYELLDLYNQLADDAESQLDLNKRMKGHR